MSQESRGTQGLPSYFSLELWSPLASAAPVRERVGFGTELRLMQGLSSCHVHLLASGFMDRTRAPPHLPRASLSPHAWIGSMG